MKKLVQLKLKETKNKIKFEDLPVGSTFEWYDSVNGEGIKYLGMKVYFYDWNEYGILDLSDEVGTVYKYYNEVKIIRVLNGIIVEEVEGD